MRPNNAESVSDKLTPHTFPRALGLEVAKTRIGWVVALAGPVNESFII